MSKSLTPIIKKYNAKRLKKDNPYAPQRIQFNSIREASLAVWEIHSSTGRECYNDGDIVNVYR